MKTSFTKNEKIEFCIVVICVILFCWGINYSSTHQNNLSHEALPVIIRDDSLVVKEKTKKTPLPIKPDSTSLNYYFTFVDSFFNHSTLHDTSGESGIVWATKIVEKNDSTETSVSVRKDFEEIDSSKEKKFLIAFNKKEKNKSDTTISFYFLRNKNNKVKYKECVICSQVFVYDSLSLTTDTVQSENNLRKKDIERILKKLKG